MKADLYTAEARAEGAGGLAHRTAAGFVVVTSADGTDMIALIEDRQNESDLIDHVVATAQTAGPESFAMLFTAGGELYLIASGNAAATVRSASAEISMTAVAGQVLVHPISAGINESSATIRLHSGQVAADGSAGATLEAGTVEAAWAEVAVGGAAFTAAVTATPVTATPPENNDAMLANTTDAAITEPAADAVTEPTNDATAAPSTVDAAADAATDPTDSETAAPSTVDAAGEQAPTDTPAVDAAIGELADDPAALAIDLTDPTDESAPGDEPTDDDKPVVGAGSFATAAIPASPPLGDFTTDMAPSSPPSADDIVFADDVVAGDAPTADEPASAAPAETPAAKADVGPVMVLGVACPQGHHNHPDAVYCSQCGTKMGVHQTTVLINGPRPPLGVLVVDDGTTYSLGEDLVIGREPTTHDAVLAGVASPMILSDETLSLSRKHAHIVLDEWTVAVVDLNSSNGTYLSRAGQPEAWSQLEPAVITQLEAGDRLRIGGRTIQVELHHVR